MRIGIVGGGIIGCAIAWELAKMRGEVEVFEPRGIGAGATQASAGALVPYVESHQGGPLRQLAVRSLSMYDDFVEAVRRDSGMAVEFARCGSLEIALSYEEAAVLKGCAAAAEGIAWHEETRVSMLQPEVTPDAAGGLEVPFHAYVSANGLVRALVAAAERRGVRVHTVGVVNIDATTDGATLSTSSGSSHSFDRIVLAAGAWTPELRGVPPPPVRPVKGQLLRVRCQAGEIRRILWSSACYVVPQAGGELLVGATMEEAGFDEQPTPAAAGGLLAGFERLLPGLEPSIVDHRVGLRPASPDDLPLVGPAAEAPSVIYAAGHFRNGIILAPLTAALVADLIRGGADPALGALSPSRFRL